MHACLKILHVGIDDLVGFEACGLGLKHPHEALDPLHGLPQELIHLIAETTRGLVFLLLGDTLDDGGSRACRLGKEVGHFTGQLLILDLGCFGHLQFFQNFRIPPQVAARLSGLDPVPLTLAPILLKTGIHNLDLVPADTWLERVEVTGSLAADRK